MLQLDRLDPADPGRDDAADPQRVERQLAVPAGVRDGFAGGDQCELREPVQTSCLLDREQLPRLEVGAGAGAVEDAALAGRPALEQGVGADA